MIIRASKLNAVGRSGIWRRVETEPLQKISRYRSAFVAASGLIGVSAADDEKKHELEIVANCLSREAPAFFSGAGAPEKSIKWNTGHTAAEVIITRAATVLATYHVVESTKSIGVSYQEHEFSDGATNERHGRMVNRCLFEAGYDNILIDKKD